MEKDKAYLELLKFCLNDHLPVPKCIKDINWHELLEFGKKHTIVGVYIPTVLMKDGKLKKEDFMGNKPTDDDVMEWVFEDYKMRKNSTGVFERTQKASEWFREQGFRNCILKGQGNALMYPDPLLRTCGDIDIWLEGTREEILAFTTKYYNMHASPLHVDFPMFKETDVEVHFHPSRMYNPYMNKKLWAYCDTQANEQFEHWVSSADGKYKFTAPTIEFNTFYQLDHIFKHLINEGVGLRQVIDYFFLLRKRHDEGVAPGADKALISLLNRFNLKKFSRAMMYVLHEFLGLEEKYLYIKPHQGEGEFLLNEILEAGNFGKHEQRLTDSLEGVQGHVRRFLVLTAFKYRLLRHYPTEAFWMPLRDLRYHFSQKKKEKEESKRQAAEGEPTNT